MPHRPIRSVTMSEYGDSDDVSALSMAGASVIAYRAQLLQQAQEINHNNNDTIHEDEAEHDVAEEEGQQRRSSMDENIKAKNKSRRRASAATTPNELYGIRSENVVQEADNKSEGYDYKEKKSKKKKKHKSKKHKKHRSKDYIEVMELPINEICFPSDIDHAPPSLADDSHDSISHTRPQTSSLVKGGNSINPSVASTAESTGSRYLRRDSIQTCNSGSGPPQNSFTFNTFRTHDLPDIPQSNNSLRSSFASSHHSIASNRSSLLHNSIPETNAKAPPPSNNLDSSHRLRSSFRSHCSIDSFAQKSYHSEQISHLSGLDSVAHKSVHSSAAYSQASSAHTADLERVRNDLECAKLQEVKVVELHSRLESEVLRLIERSESMDDHRSKIVSKIKMATEERERLQGMLNTLLDENTKMSNELQNIEEQEDEKRLDDVLDGMQAKMKALRFKSVKKGSKKHK